MKNNVYRHRLYDISEMLLKFLNTVSSWFDMRMIWWMHGPDWPSELKSHQVCVYLENSNSKRWMISVSSFFFQNLKIIDRQLNLMSRQPLLVLWHSVVIFWLMAQILGKLMFRNRMKSSRQALWGFENVVTSYKHLKMSGKCSDVV